MRPVGNRGQSAAMKKFTAAAVSSLLIAASASCAGAAVDKQGAPVSAAVTVLHFGAADVGEAGLAYFSDAVARTSHHRLRVHVDPTTYFTETRGGETRLVPDLRSGRVDFAYVPSRDWAATGDPGFRAVQSPFEVTTTQASVALARSAAAPDLLKGMQGYDVVGLGLIPAEPRRLITRNPVLSASDLQGSRIRIYDSRETEGLVSALGAHPVLGMNAGEARRALQGQALDGIESAPIYIAQNNYTADAPYLTSFAVIPKFEVIAAGKSAWAKLSAPDRQAIDAAAAQTVGWASQQVARNESRELAQLCARGLVVVQPSLAALDDMARAASAAVASNASTRAAISRLAAAVSGLGPRASASALPGACRLATTAQQARAVHASSASAGSHPTSAAHGPTIPLGTYQVTVTKEQWAASGQNGPDWASDITFTWTFKADGTLRETQRPDFPDQGPLTGKYVIAGDTVTVTYDYTPTGAPPSEVVRWSFRDGTLTFTVVSVQDRAGRLIYEQPWRKIA